MADTTRRDFLSTAGVGLSAAALAMPRQTRAAGALKKVRVGLVGAGGRGTGVAMNFAGLDTVEVLYACDPDKKRAEAAAGKLQTKTGRAPQAVQDLRQVLDDKAIDAVIVATPDHWHAPAALLALAAGKHVYVEKPCSHNLREGRWLVEAARRTGLVVQTGTQSRSGLHVKRAMELLRDGAIGEVLVSKAWNSQRRRDIGREQPSAPPPELDYDLWLGPAPEVPYQANRLHYGWHWFYAFGTGDFGNDGVHDVDLARAGLGMETQPARVMAAGGKYFFDDDQEFPDTQTVLFEYPAAKPSGRPRQLIFEMRIWSPYRQEGFENGNAFYGTEGMLLLGKGEGWQLFGPKNKLLDKMGAEERDVTHIRDFLACIESGARPAADVEIGHLSASLCHLGNIAVRTGRPLVLDPAAERIPGDAEADRLLGREYRSGHWAVPAPARS